MSNHKIVLVGAGSTVFTPGLIADLVRSAHLHDATVALVDLDPTALEVMASLALRIARERGVSLRVETATDRRRVLQGASFVTVTIAVGGARAWEHDLRIPERQSVYQTVGDSVGPGGVFRALRHVPELVAIAHDMEELCPDAWLFNYCNPLSANLRGVHKSSPIKCAGLCHGILGTRQTVAKLLCVPPGELDVVAAGVNHLCWLLSIHHGDRDVYPAFRHRVEETFSRIGLGRYQFDPSRERGEPSSEHPAATPGAADDPYEGPQQVSALLMEIYGLYPSPGDRHVAEFFPYFLRKEDARLAYGLQGGLDMTNDVIAGKGTLWDRLRSQAEGRVPLDERLFEETREGERVVSIMESILHDGNTRELAVNVSNDGLIPGLPPWAIVEVPGLINRHGVNGIGPASLPRAIEDVLRARVYQQELTVDAALSGDRRLALQALLADPLVRDVESATSMLDEALEAHAQYLPQFDRRSNREARHAAS